MNLSKRLQAVATLVDMNKRVIDVGCDHAYLDIYLTLNNGNKCVASDINKNALDNAKRNIKKYDLEDKIETKLTNGLTDMFLYDDDNIVISGMGTYTILAILKTNRLSNTLIISSNNYTDVLRKEVLKLGYIIDSELFIFDKGKPYVIIKFIKGNKRYSKKDIIYGPILRKNKEYKNYLIKKNRKIYNNLSNTKPLLKLKYLFELLKLKFM